MTIIKEHNRIMVETNNTFSEGLMDYIDFYYSNVLGHTPDDAEALRATSNTIEYLLDCGYAKSEILHILLQCKATERLTAADLPDSLWDGSLIKRGVFYYHHTLQITSTPPHYDAKLSKEIMEPYFLEMRIRYSMDNLIQYFYEKLGIDMELMDKQRDAARFKALLKKYDRLSFVSALDFVLSLIDYSSYAKKKVLSVFDLEQNETEVFEELKRKAAEASFHGKNVVVWRK